MISQIRQCMRPECRFRFPVIDKNPSERCPRCGSLTRAVESPYAGMRVNEKGRIEVPMEGLLDNIRSAFNVGSMFRTADGAGIRRLHLCGITPTPDHPKVGKTALGAEYAVGWTQHWSSLEAARLVKNEGLQLWALEGGLRCESLADAMRSVPRGGLALVVGNEVSGVDPGVLELCDRVVGIPMLGLKESLNAAVAFGVAAYLIRFGSQDTGKIATKQQ